MTTGYVFETGHRAHTHPQAPESAARLDRLMAYLDAQGELAALSRIAVEPIPWEWIAAAHTTHHVETVRRLAQTGRSRASVDTYLTPEAPEVARLAASCAIAATQAVLTGDVANAFSFSRPPGHHAHATHAMGYCLFNNVAVAALFALREAGLERVLIVDIDAHHGNGTEDIFYASREVLFVSLHQHPWYPGTGDVFRTGVEAGTGYNYNVALPTWTGDEGYRRAVKELIRPLAERYCPQLILVSAGFDAHWMDQSSVLGLSVQGYYDLVAGLRDLADQYCQSRIVLILEGGYNLDSTAPCAAASLRALRDIPMLPDPLGPCPDPPVAPLDLTLTYLQGFMELMAPASATDFYSHPIEVPYRLR